MNDKCLDCGAVLRDGQPCDTYFHQMLFWENEEPANGHVHHLMVLCYHLQHPALYSPEGLAYAHQMLKKFVLEGESPAQVRQEAKWEVASDNRLWNIKGTAESHGFYPVPITWHMTASDVVAGGIGCYCQNVQIWAATVQEQLKVV